ncbi:accessory Sec system protein Asp1, partial [Staphylococcus aureus]|nr:accessory Sec system protein Asp1 [Staphylococcus aureus]
MRVTPFDAQILPNMSSQLYETNIGVWLGELKDNDLRSVMDQLSQYINQHEQTMLHVLTRSVESDIPQWFKDEIHQLNKVL